MKHFNDSFTFDHTTCVVDNDDYGLAFHRFTGVVLATHGLDHDVLLVDVEEYRRAYGEFPPNETLNTFLDFGYWYRQPTPCHNGIIYDVALPIMYSRPEPEFRADVLRDRLLENFMPSVTDYARFDGTRDIEIRPWRYSKDPDADAYTIDECKPEEAEGWGLYGRTFQGPAWHLLDVASKQQAYWMRATLAPLLIVAPLEARSYATAQQRAESMAGLKFDGG